MKRRIVAGALGALLITIGFGSRAVAQSDGAVPPIYTLVPLGIPGVPIDGNNNWGAAGINSDGVIVGAWSSAGYAFDIVGPRLADLIPVHGFRWEKGVVSPVQVNEAQLLSQAIPNPDPNDWHYYQLSECRYAGYTCSIVHIVPRSINDAGTIVGSWASR